jgi:hypothetical protein
MIVVTLEGLYSAWMVLNNLLGDLRDRGVFIPNLTYADFRNSKMLLEYLRSLEEDLRASDDADEKLRIDMEDKILRLRESLLSWAEAEVGIEYREEWEERVRRGLREEIDFPEEDPSAHISDLPREKEVSFFRIRLPEGIPVEIVSEIAEHCNVLISLDGERHLQVSGKRECVRKAMKILGETFYGKSQIKKEDN